MLNLGSASYAPHSSSVSLLRKFLLSSSQPLWIIILIIQFPVFLINCLLFHETNMEKCKFAIPNLKEIYSKCFKDLRYVKKNFQKLQAS